MKAYLKMIEIRTYGPMVLHPITDVVRKIVEESDTEAGIAWISVEGATPALLVADKEKALRYVNYITKLIPFSGWSHGNAYAHLISTITSTNIAIPVLNKTLFLRENEEIFLLETRSVYNHIRRILVEIHGR